MSHLSKKKRFYWKGKCVSEEKYNIRLKQQKSGQDTKNAAKKKLNVDKNEELDESIMPGEGRRIVELLFLAKQLWCTSCKECLSLEYIERETRRGLGSVLEIRCHQCLLINMITTGKQHCNDANLTPHLATRFDVNTKLAMGMVDSGIGYNNVNKLLACLNMPIIDFKTYKRYEAEAGICIENLAKKSCEEATELERQLTIQNMESLKKQLPEDMSSSFNKNIDSSNSVTFDTVIQVVASYDMGWSTRSTGRDYDSLNGFGAIVGLHSKAVLDYHACNRKCRKCDLGHTPFDHDCRLNFYGSAKAMEGFTANKLVNDSSILKSKNVQIGVLVGDDDSSAIAACRQNASHSIGKLSDVNHTSKGVKGELYNVAKQHKDLKNDGVKYLHRCFTYAIAQNKGKSSEMAKAIKCIPYHIYNDHSKCGSWCGWIKDKENYDHRIIPGGFTDTNLFHDLIELFDKLAKNADKFSVGVSSNVNESLNASMASKANKNKFLSSTASADIRWSATVCGKNVGSSYTHKSTRGVLVSPARHHLKYVSRLDKLKKNRSEFIKTPKYKEIRMKNKSIKQALRYQKEASEGTTYKSSYGLLNEPAVQSHEHDYEQSTSNDCDIQGTLDENFPIIYFDLETTSCSSDCDIIQIAAKCGHIHFDTYIFPKQNISSSASAIHGLRKVDGNLLLHGKKVNSVSLRMAISNFYSWLKSIEKKCYLAAHNLAFDGPKILASIGACSLTDEFSDLIEGFIDTLKIIRESTQRKGKGECTLTGLAAWQSISSNNAHNATADVEILEKIIDKLSINYETLLGQAVRFSDASYKWHEQSRIRKLLPNTSELKKVVGEGIRKKFISANITIEDLKNIYTSSGDDAVKELLRKKVNGKVSITNHGPTIKKILEWLRKIKE